MYRTVIPITVVHEHRAAPLSDGARGRWVRYRARCGLGHLGDGTDADGSHLDGFFRCVVPVTLGVSTMEEIGEVLREVGPGVRRHRKRQWMKLTDVPKIELADVRHPRSFVADELIGDVPRCFSFELRELRIELGIVDAVEAADTSSGHVVA